MLTREAIDAAADNPWTINKLVAEEKQDMRVLESCEVAGKKQLERDIDFISTVRLAASQKNAAENALFV